MGGNRWQEMKGRDWKMEVCDIERKDVSQPSKRNKNLERRPVKGQREEKRGKEEEREGNVRKTSGEGKEVGNG